MPNAFDFSASPFDCLSPQERERVREVVDVAYFPQGRTILDVGAVPAQLYVVMKGVVAQHDGEQVVASYGPQDSFDARALMAGRSSSRFVAREEVLAYELPREAVMELIGSNAAFGALLFAELSDKLGALAELRGRHELQALGMARVADAFVRPVRVLDAATDIVTVAGIFQAEHVSSVLVRESDRPGACLGIFTRASLQRAILDGTPPARLPAARFANFELLTTTPEEPIGEALARMLRGRVHRLVVLRAGEVQGVLEALDLFSFLANHSYLITVQIDMAQDLGALADAASKITRMVSLLHRGGTRIGLIASLVTELNTRLFQRAWSLIAPPELVANSCLFVMGSEGRGEQILKTDQDNGLLLRDGYRAPPDLPELAARFVAALADFGYPPCPGGVMLERPRWRMSSADFAATLRACLHERGPEQLMDLAIFLDARAVCGDARLLRELRDRVLHEARGDDMLLARFASAIDAFGAGTAWWARLLGDANQPIDLKKEGMFALVHGVRSLALAAGIAGSGTEERVAALAAQGLLGHVEADELLQALHVLMELRLQAGLDQIERRQAVTGLLEPRQLGSLERSLLKDALGVVKRFRGMLHRRFQLDRL
jgi:CBS domain-containing protein